jgi:hypothetical protein
MPYVSDAQRRWAHTPSAKESGFPTAEWDRKSKGQKGLPEHVAATGPRFKSRKQQRRYERSGGR